MQNKGTLFIVPTPVGNLQDMTFRGIEVLKSSSLILAEDTRNSGTLLKHFSIETPMMSYHKFNEKQRCKEILARLLEGENIALISDAGTPGISDPGQILIAETISAGYEVVCLPGATAFVPALVSSGLNTERFTFCGFLPEKLKDRTAYLEELKSHKETLIFYISPHNLHADLKFFYSILSERRAVLAKEISKIHETFYRGTLSTLVDDEDINLKGEFILMIEGFVTQEIGNNEIKTLLHKLLSEGMNGKDAVKLTAEKLNVRKNLVYDIFTSIKDN
ncbi:MAG: 16S rRNA (cytidine(1402)-2'-O)-methyltransferase [Candidatus Cloacimonetes bacterium]|nr:16S rRNA (cytidine(1402)-2'-O)-methyltransferase [Candidatus Cloacimonadota bacterium]